MARARQSLLLAPLAVLCLWSTSLTTLAWREARLVERMPFVSSGRIVDSEPSSVLKRLLQAPVVRVALTDAEGDSFGYSAPDHSILRPLKAGDSTAIRSNVAVLYGPKREERLRTALAALSTTATTEQAIEEHRRIRSTLGRAEVLHLAHRGSLWDPVWAFGLLSLVSFGVLLLALPGKRAQRSAAPYPPVMP